MNGGRNYNGPKVDRCLREIRLFAGISGGSSGARHLLGDSDNPRGVHRCQSDEPDDQQERPARESAAESSEAIRRTSGVLDEEMVPSARRRAGTRIRSHGSCPPRDDVRH